MTLSAEDIKKLIKKKIPDAIIEINDIKIETIRIECSELDLVINVYKDYDFMPVFISKTNGKANFSLILNDFKHL